MGYVADGVIQWDEIYEPIPCWIPVIDYLWPVAFVALTDGSVIIWRNDANLLFCQDPRFSADVMILG